MKRADLLDLTIPPAYSTRSAALKAFQRARKQARKAARASQQARTMDDTMSAFQLYRVWEEPGNPEACAIVTADQLQHVTPGARVELIDTPTVEQLASYLDGELESRNSASAGIHEGLARLLTTLAGDDLARRVLLHIAERGTILRAGAPDTCV